MQVQVLARDTRDKARHIPMSVEGGATILSGELTQMRLVTEATEVGLGNDTFKFATVTKGNTILQHIIGQEEWTAM